MIYLFTGQPGSQKTANMINFVLTDSQFENRQVYYFNISDCNVPGWIELSEEEARTWYELPEGSVILFDEAQRLWRPEKWDAKKRRDITEMETHRHRGFDMVLTTQHPKLIHADVRRQVQQHRDYKKPFGVKSIAYVWEECKDFHAKAEANKISGTVPKGTFDLYKSTVLNTHKKRIPLKAWLVLGALFLTVGIFGWFAYDLSTRKDQSAAIAADPAPQQPQSGSLRTLSGSSVAATQQYDFKPLYPLDPEEYIKLHTPRIPDLPYTAPIYDELVQPTVAPKVRCYGYRRDGVYHCKCVTQQMTPVKMAYEQCVHTVQNGLWDAAPVTSATYNARGDLM
jgi:hypothetical protein